MEIHDHDLILRDAAARVAHAADGSLDVAVPSCPGWAMADLLAHLVVVLSFWSAIADGGETPPTDWVSPDRPDDVDLLDWYRSEVDSGAAAVCALDPAATRWSWSDQNDGAFIKRRLAQEFSVHAWDAESAVGTPGAIDSSIAADGIDEFLSLFLPANPESLAGEPLNVHLHATDADGEWTLKIGDGAHHLERSHAKADLGVRAPAEHLLLWLWGRAGVDTESFSIFGDPTLLAEFSRRLSRP